MAIFPPPRRSGIRCGSILSGSILLATIHPSNPPLLVSSTTCLTRSHRRLFFQYALLFPLFNPAILSCNGRLASSASSGSGAGGSWYSESESGERSCNQVRVRRWVCKGCVRVGLSRVYPKGSRRERLGWVLACRTVREFDLAEDWMGRLEGCVGGSCGLEVEVDSSAWVVGCLSCCWPL